MFVNSSRIAAIWLETPLDEPIGTSIDVASNPPRVSGRSSAYLNIQIPDQDSPDIGFHAACAIDARWLKSDIQGSQIALTGSQPLYSMPWLSMQDPLVFPASDDGNWRPVRLRADWLRTLTPQLDDGNEGWNTVSSILTDMGISNNTGLVNDWGGVGTTMASVISALVADGMSRVGYEQNGGTPNSMESITPWPQTDEEEEESWEPLIRGKFELPFVYTDDGNLTNRTPLYWSVAVTGLGYRTYSTAFYLATAVLLLHVVLSLAHIIWVMCTGETSTAWSSVTDQLSLALISPPPKFEFENTSGGIKHYKTHQTPMRIRVVENGNVNAGVQMVAGKEFLPGKHLEIIAGQEY